MGRGGPIRRYVEPTAVSTGGKVQPFKPRAPVPQRRRPLAPPAPPAPLPARSARDAARPRRRPPAPRAAPARAPGARSALPAACRRTETVRAGTF